MPQSRSSRSPLLAALGRVIVLPDPPRTTRGPLLIAPEPSYTGVVAAVAPDVAEVTVGQRVVYARRVGVEVEVDGTTYLTLRLADCLAVLP